MYSGRKHNLYKCVYIYIYLIYVLYNIYVYMHVLCNIYMY